jgi:hypothetical protein
MPSAAPEIWILRLVPDVRFGRLLAALVIFCSLLGVCAVAGVFEDESDGVRAHVAVFFAVILAYIVPIFHYIVARCEEAFDELESPLQASEEETESMRNRIRHRSVGRQLALVTIGLAAGFAHNWLLAGRVGFEVAILRRATDATLSFGTLLVWVVMTTAILSLVGVARLFASLARRVRIDLLQPSQLRPFARVAVSSTLAMVGAEAAFPILSLDGPQMFPLTVLPGLVAVFVSMVALFALPLLPLQRAIAATKRTEGARISALIAEVAAATTSEHERFARLAPLLTYRRAIEQAREWPFDSGTMSRLAFYLIIPPLTWIAAAIIQHVVDIAL